MKKLFVVFAIALLGGYIGTKIAVVEAQTTPTALQLTGSAPHTTCAVTPATTTFCFANDGLWQSINGGAYAQLGVATGGVTTGGVTSFNGRTGVVVPVPSDYPNAVTSVNSKTGAVVITATTALQ